MDKKIYFPVHRYLCKMAKKSTAEHLHDTIILHGCRQHNLKNIIAKIPKNQLIVITGVSGSGKSSLAFDTLYAEGQRKYVESLSAYARQFISKMEKPDVDFIEGLVPTMAIEQKTLRSNPRSTVGTFTEINDYLKVLYARIGTTYSPISNQAVDKHTVSDVLKCIEKFKIHSAVFILAPIKTDQEGKLDIDILRKKGLTRIWYKEKMIKLEAISTKQQWDKKIPIFSIISRAIINDSDEQKMSFSDAIQSAFNDSQGYCSLWHEGRYHFFSNHFEADGMVFTEPTPSFFSYNSPQGSCRACKGLGEVIGIDDNKVIPDKTLSIEKGAVKPWESPKMEIWKKNFIQYAKANNFPIHTPYLALNETEKKTLWEGNQSCKGIFDFFQYIQTQFHKIHYRIFYARYRGKTLCLSCKGTRLRKETSYVKIKGMTIMDCVLMPIDKLYAVLKTFKLTAKQKEATRFLLTEIIERLKIINLLGLGYLTLNRLSSSLSGGETQRLKLSTLMGSNLVGACYVLDEPSIGLHSKDNQNLIKVLKQIRDQGNTLLVVEHDREIIASADYLIEMGPYAGSLGGEITYQGPFNKIQKQEKSLIYQYLRDKKRVLRKKNLAPAKSFYSLFGAHEHNLKNIDVHFPINRLTVICGVSGSGKSTLVKKLLFPCLKMELGEIKNMERGHIKVKKAAFDYQFDGVELMDQQAQGRSVRSNAVTYTKIWDEIRQLYASQQQSIALGLTPSSFSFNVEGGRCETCLGEGRIKIEMQFLSDIYIPCDTCHGNRFMDFILSIKFRDKNVKELLALTINELKEHFKDINKIEAKIALLQEIGLGYVKAGQSSDTLSGGELQRLKIATYLMKKTEKKNTLFIFDEPSTGLHFEDINKLLFCMDKLLQQGHSIIIIEHNTDIIKQADYIIELGPKGGEDGGHLLLSGTLEALKKTKKVTPTLPLLK